MQQLRQIIPALMIGVLAGGIGTYQSLQSNPTNTNPNPMFTTQSVAGTREQPPSDGGTEDLKIGKKFIPCPGSEEFLKGTLYGGMTEWQLDGGISWPAGRNLYSKSKYTIGQIYAQTTNPFPQPTDLLCQYEIDPVRSGTLPLDRSFFNRALGFPKGGCTAINEPTRIGFECDTAGDTPNDGGLGQ